MDIFSDANAPFPTKVTWFESKSSRGAVTGLVEFETVEEACEVSLGYSHAGTVTRVSPNQLTPATELCVTAL